MRTRPGKKALAGLAAAALAGCAIGPDYQRPGMELPASLVAEGAAVPAAQDWWTLFRDPVLDRLVAEALAANRDLAAAAARIEQARAQATIAGADRFPAAGVEVQRSRDRSSQLGAFPLPPNAIETNTNRAVARFSWELDFWGKYRRANEAAQADLLAAQAGRDAVRASLVADVARAHFALQALDESLEIADRTRDGRRIALGLLRLRHEAGVLSELELRQYEAEVRAAEALVPALRRDRTRQEGALAVLLGRSPRMILEGGIERGATLSRDAVEVPAGLPSELLRRRPDLREAEARLVAANARIGVARAAYYPSITLTGFLGGESQSLADLFTGPARTWSLAAGLLQPLYAGGEIRGGAELADARTREAAANYERAVAQAFKEVRDAIALQATARDALVARREQVVALERSLSLAKLRHEGGLTGLLELLDAERQLLAVRLEAIAADRDRRNAVVDLYLALGA
ncbi:MAG: efflux transporter outer membrane subunit [Burkholderiales bacterium]